MNEWIGIENDEFLTMETSFEVEDQSSLFQFKHAFSEKDVKVRPNGYLNILNMFLKGKASSGYEGLLENFRGAATGRRQAG